MEPFHGGMRFAQSISNIQSVLERIWHTDHPESHLVSNISSSKQGEPVPLPITRKSNTRCGPRRRPIITACKSLYHGVMLKLTRRDNAVDTACCRSCSVRSMARQTIAASDKGLS